MEFDRDLVRLAAAEPLSEEAALQRASRLPSDQHLAIGCATRSRSVEGDDVGAEQLERLGALSVRTRAFVTGVAGL